MTKKYKFGVLILLSLAGLLSIALLLRNSNFAVLNPKGTIANQQYDLIVAATLLMLIIVLPVLVLTFVIAWRYREGNTKAKYSPELAGNRIAEAVWWTVPLVIIVVLSGMIWKSSHELDPFKPVEANNKPMTIQVVALDWKWLFIYPEQNIATVNYVQFPENTPINFKLTSDGAMNSFWIPQLGGQIYTMAGMETSLHLMSNQTGEFNGQSANLSGEGFAGMKFVAKSTSAAEFDRWVNSTKASPKALDQREYQRLSEPSKNNTPFYYANVDQNVYNTTINKYLSPQGDHGGSHNGH